MELTEKTKNFEVKRLADQEYSQTFGWARSAIESGLDIKAASLIEELDREELNTVGRDGMTLLCSGIRLGRELVVAMLVECGADVNAKTADGQLPLMVALRSKREHLVLLLLAAGADQSLRENKDQDSAARLAARLTLPTALAALLASGSDLSERDENGNRLMDYANKYSSREILALIEAKYPKTELMDKAQKRLAAFATQI